MTDTKPIDLASVVEKAMQAATRILEDARSVSDEEYYYYLQFLNAFALPSRCRCGAGSIDTDLSISNAMCLFDPRKGLDGLKLALSDLHDNAVADTDDRIGDIVHLNAMLAYWRSITSKQQVG
jgi:hypothetical protein